MAKSKLNPKVDAYIRDNKKWQKEIKALRRIVLDCDLTEELKWGCPCYTLQGRNIVLIHVFNEYCALLFFKGALLKDSHGMLVQQTRNVQAGRQIRFTNVREIEKQARQVQAHVYEAIEVEASGRKVKLKQTEDFPVPEEFQQRLDEDPALQAAFEGLTPGRQRGYLFYFAAPKQSKTRASRVEKHLKRILSGKGLNDL